MKQSLIARVRVSHFKPWTVPTSVLCPLIYEVKDLNRTDVTETYRWESTCRRKFLYLEIMLTHQNKFSEITYNYWFPLQHSYKDSVDVMIFAHLLFGCDFAQQMSGLYGISCIHVCWRCCRMSKMLRCAANDDIVTIKADDAGDKVKLVFESPSRLCLHSWNMIISNKGWRTWFYRHL